jgi:hypothetical protein
MRLVPIPLFAPPQIRRADVFAYGGVLTIGHHAPLSFNRKTILTLAASAAKWTQMTRDRIIQPSR